MLKNISNLGTLLQREQQVSIKGGNENFCALPENYEYCDTTGGGSNGGGDQAQFNSLTYLNK